MAKRKIVIFTINYHDAMYLANTLYNPTIGNKTICGESAFNNGDFIRVESGDCVYYIGVE